MSRNYVQTRYFFFVESRTASSLTIALYQSIYFFISFVNYVEQTASLFLCIDWHLPFCYLIQSIVGCIPMSFLSLNVKSIDDSLTTIHSQLLYGQLWDESCFSTDSINSTKFLLFSGVFLNEIKNKCSHQERKTSGAKIVDWIHRNTRDIHLVENILAAEK